MKLGSIVGGFKLHAWNGTINGPFIMIHDNFVFVPSTLNNNFYIHEFEISRLKIRDL